MFLVEKLHTLFENIFYFGTQHLPVRTYVYNNPYRKNSSPFLVLLLLIGG
jgi:hypothetical protein